MKTLKDWGVVGSKAVLFGLVASFAIAQPKLVQAQNVVQAEPIQAEPETPEPDALKKAPPAVLVLDPSDKVWALQVSSGSRLIVKKGDVAINSTHKSALWDTDSSIEVQQGTIGVAGDVLLMGKTRITPSPRTGARTVADTYPVFRVPPPPRVVSEQKLFLNNQAEVTLEPGIYTGGIFAGGQGMHIIMPPGVYVMNGGDFFLSGCQVEGKGVTIVLAGEAAGSFWCAAGTKLNLAAPTTGPLKDLLIVSRSKGWNKIDIGSTEAKLTGAIYAPEAGIGIAAKSTVTVDRITCFNLSVGAASTLTVTGEGIPGLTTVKDATPDTPPQQ